MSKKIMGLLAAVVLISAAVYANDPWKDKDFTSWDAKDIQKVLNDSPWSKQFQFGGGGGGEMAAPFTAAGDAGHDGIVSGSGGGTGGRTSASAGTPAAQGMGPQMNFVVRWYSSRTIRQAMARQKELDGTAPEDARKALITPPDAYQVLLQASNMGMFAKEGEESLKEHSYLMSKKTKEKIAPSHVIIRMGGADGKRPVAIIFEFARKAANGEPIVASDEKGFEFFTQAGKTPLKVNFDLSKMVDKQGLDL